MFKIEFETDNAAFEDERAEIVRVLRGITDKIESGKYINKIYDINGNSIGSVTWYSETYSGTKGS